MTPLIERIAKELSHDFGGHGDITSEHLNAASNVIDAITLWAADNPTQAAPWEEHFRGAGGPWPYQFQHKKRMVDD